MPDIETLTLPPCAHCGDPASHHRRNDDGTFAESAIDQSPCPGYKDPMAPAFGGEQPPNRHVLPDAESFADPTRTVNLGPGQQSSVPDANLTDVLVNYDEIFTATHGRYYQLIAQLFQENAELRAGFNQAHARMLAAEAKVEALTGEG